MAPPHTRAANSAQASSQLTCPKCGKIFTDAKRLKAHVKGHDKSYKCRFCAKRFGKAGQVPRHELWSHDVNVSTFVCYISQCNRVRLGLKSEAALIAHLRSIHHGATLADNTKAGQKGGFLPAPANECGETTPAKDEMTIEASDMPIEEETPPIDTDDDMIDEDYSLIQEEATSIDETRSLSYTGEVNIGRNEDDNLTPAEYKTRLSQLNAKLQEERKLHEWQMKALHELYKDRVEIFRDLAKTGTREQVAKEAEALYNYIPG